VKPVIKKLRVKNYKSLQDVEIPLDRFVVFVGPNNSGKSNIFDCFRFVRELAEQGEVAVRSRGGFRYIVWGGDIRRAIDVELEATLLDQQGQERSLKYRVRLASSVDHFQIEEESLSLWDGQQERKLLEFPSDGGMATARDEEGNQIGGIGRGRYQLYIRDFQDPRYGFLGSFARSMLSWTVYDLVPSRMGMPSPARRDLQLQREGENFSSVIHSLQAEYSEHFREIENLLRTGLPEVRRLFTALTDEGQTYVSWEEEGVPLRIPGWAMSDGTLRLLGQLAALFSPEPPSLACFEEPENCIHPHLLETVVDALRWSSKTTQVLVSTHSPYLLNFVQPESLRIVEKVKGKTRCRTVEDKKGIKQALKVLGLGELWYSGDLGGAPP